MCRAISVISLIAFLIFRMPLARGQYTITTVAGGVPNNLPALQVGLGGRLSVSRDSAGNLYVAADGPVTAIYKIDASGQLTTVAGNGTGYDSSGDGGPATSAGIRSPGAVYVDGFGNIFIADTYSDRIREVVAATGIIQTVAGNGTSGFSGDGGPATAAALSAPGSVYVDNAGNIFFADSNNQRIREVVAATGNIQTVAGDGTGGFSGDGGPATSAAIGEPLAVFVDGSGNIFFAVTIVGYNNRIREVVAATGIIQTVAGNGADGFSGDGGPATSAALGFSTGIFVDRSGNIFIADTGNNRVREVVAATGIIQTVAGNGTNGFSGDGGPATTTELLDPTGVCVDDAGNIFIAEENRIREVVATTGIIQTVAGNGTCCFIADGGPAVGSELAFINGGGVSLDRSGNIFIADQENNRVREVLGTSGNIQTVAGNGQFGFSGDGGPATSASLNFPSGVFVDSAGNIFIGDYANQRIRKVDAATGVIQTVAGNGVGGLSGDGGPATSAELFFPISVSGDRQGNLLIVDSGNNRIRRVSGVVAVVGIGVGPSSATAAPGAAQQFTASVTNAINTAVTWSLSGTGCTGSGCGTISSQGLYTAPAATGSPLTVTVTATSVADNTKSATATITVQGKQATSVAVTSSTNPSLLGQAVALTASVSPASGSGTPTGTVTFQDGTTPLGTAPLNSSGSATLTASALAVAAHPITATYSGDSGFFSNSGSLTENVSYGICPLYLQTASVKGGAAFPMKLYLCDVGGSDVSSSALVLHATQITSASGYTGGAASSGGANPGGNFRFEAYLGPSGGYIFNVNTAGLAPGRYTLQFTAGSDPLPHAANFAVR